MTDKARRKASRKTKKRQIALNAAARQGAGEYTGKRKAFTIDANGVITFI